MSSPLAAHESSPTAAPDWDMIAFEVKSWGAPVTQWQFTPDYGGVWIEIERKPDAEQAIWLKTYYTLEPDGGRFAELARIIERLPEPAPDSQGCGDMMPDMPYGTVRLTRGATTTEIAWNSGCLDEDYASFTAILREANELVSGWGKAVPPALTEETLMP